jgi:DNA-binding NarL/FixJ family response regulator
MTSLPRRPILKLKPSSSSEKESRLASPALPLPKRQCEIMRLAADGVPQRLIAQRLGISHRTVEMHARRLRKRLGATTMAQAILIAIRLKQITIEGCNAQGSKID